jgi:hypothetical protein
MSTEIDEDDPRMEEMLIRFCSKNRHVDEFPPGTRIWCILGEFGYKIRREQNRQIYEPCQVAGLSQNDKGQVDGLVIQLPDDMAKFPNPPSSPYVILNLRAPGYEPRDHQDDLIVSTEELSFEEYLELRTYQENRFKRRLRRMAKRT